ncbi:MAG: DUF819 family protein [Erythrobacter sp.]|nr:DUF819 family protein [Erythrobacter sp.]
MPSLLVSPFAVLVALLTVVAISEWTARWRIFRKVGSAIIALLLGALLANLDIIPTPGNDTPIYDAVFAYILPGAIFLALLQASLRALRNAGGAMVLAFLLGAVGVAIGAFVAAYLVPIAIPDSSLAALAGMFTATYIGGSANFNAVALAYGMESQGSLYVVAILVDNVMTVLWLMLLLAFPGVMRRTRLYADQRPGAEPPTSNAHQDQTLHRPTVFQLIAPLAMAAIAVLLSDGLASFFGEIGFPVPSIIIVTTIALLVAQIPGVDRLALAPSLGMAGLLLFLVVIGASADVAALIEARSLGLAMAGFIATILFFHSIVLVGFGVLLRIEPEVIAVASVANIGGSAVAPAIAEGVGRPNLALPGVLVGLLGTALGTYAGFSVAHLLQ